MSMRGMIEIIKRTITNTTYLAAQTNLRMPILVPVMVIFVQSCSASVCLYVCMILDTCLFVF